MSESWDIIALKVRLDFARTLMPGIPDVPESPQWTVGNR